MQRLGEARIHASMWRAIIVVGSTAVTVTAAAAVAHAVAAPDAPMLAAGRGVLIAATATASLLGSAYAMRRGFIAAGIAADQSLVPSGAPRALRVAGERLGRSPRLMVVAGLLVGLVLGLVGGRLGGSGGGIFDRETIEFASGTGDDEGRARGERVAGARTEAADGAGGGEDADVEAAGSDGPGGASGSDGSDGAGGGSSPDGGNDDKRARGGTTTTTTTQPKPKAPYVCDALDDYDGDVDGVLAAVGLDDEAEMTKQACQEIENILSNPVDEIDQIIDDLVGKLPVTTTTITLPPVTTTTITLPPVTTTTITLPPLTIPSLPLL